MCNYNLYGIYTTFSAKLVQTHYTQNYALKTYNIRYN